MGRTAALYIAAPVKRGVIWMIGDRVYLVARNNMHGTVTETCDGETGRYCRVHWDDTPDNVGSWHLDGDVECWTLAESKGVR